MQKRYRFKQVHNFRDLGGYPLADGSQTKWNTLFRSDDMGLLRPEEVVYLEKRGLQTVIDLRHQEELAQSPNPFAVHATIAYHNHSVSNLDLNPDPSYKLGDMYVMMMDDHAFVRNVFKTIAESDGPVVFHCSAGKDRTGIIAATLLGLMGVETRDIINDYQQSYINIRDRFQTMDPELNQRYMNLMKSEPEAIEQFLHAIHDRYGSFVSYLSTVGVDVREQNQIVKKFTSK